MYSLVIINNEEIKNTKGVYNNVVKNLRHKEYVDALFKRNLIRHKMIWIQSKLQKIGTYVCKTSLSCFDDKRYIFDDDIKSLAYFHKNGKVNRIK